MTKFNPENKESPTYGNALGPIFKITEPEDAIQYKEAYIQYLMKYPECGSREEATRVANSNIGYYAGYGSNEDRARIESLFLCSHPIFGSIKENGVPTTEEAITAGRKIATKTN